MAQIERMDIDTIESDFDNKENAFQYNNVLSRTPCTEKGYEELDVSELNMKLRYSITPASSPMSKSLTGACLDNKNNCNSEDYLNNAIGADNTNLSRSLNSTLTKTEGLSKSKVLPLQTLSSELFVDTNRNSSNCRLLDPTDSNVTINNPNDIDENLSIPSTCSSVPDTPEAMSPTKETPKPEGSPIMRGLKSVLSMFRPSQSPIMPADDKSSNIEVLSPVKLNRSEVESVQVSTPVTTNKLKDGNSSKRSSPLKESLVFNDDLERELLWKDETTILFKEEKIPVHKLFFPNVITETSSVPKAMNATVEHMDISCDESIVVDKTNTNFELSEHSAKNEHLVTGESDNEFLDCETTFTKNESHASGFKKEVTSDESQTTYNLPIGSPDNVEKSRETDIEYKNLSHNTVNVLPGDMSINTDKASELVTDVSLNMEKIDNAVIIATMKLLSSERNDYSKIGVNRNASLDSKSQTNNGLLLENANATVCIDEESQSEHKVCCSTENLPNICREMENNTDTKQTKEHIEVPDNMVDTDVNIVKQCLVSEKSVINIDLNGHMPNNDKLDMTNTFGNTQLLQSESNIDLLPSQKNISGEDTKISNSIHPNINENMLVSHTPKNENAPIEIVSETPVDNKNVISLIKNSYNVEKQLGDNHEVIEVISITKETNCENDLPIRMSVLPSGQDFVNTINASNGQSNSDNDLNATELKSPFLDKNITNKANSSETKDISETEKESSSLQKILIENLESEISDNMKTGVNYTNLVINNVPENYHEISEPNVRSDTVLSKPPSEIPLPDDDDVEKCISENTSTSNKDCSKQDTIFEIHNSNSKSVTTELTNQPGISLNSVELNERSSITAPINEHVSEITDNRVPVQNEGNYKEIFVIQSAHVNTTEVKTDLKSENKQKPIFDLQIAEINQVPTDNIPKDLSIPEENLNSVKQKAPQLICNNTENKITEEKVFSNNEKKTFTIQNDSVSNTIDNDVNSFVISEDKNLVNVGDDDQLKFMITKGENEGDEEIITSANNSPYVSVTDLDIVMEKIIDESPKEKYNPIDTNTSYTFSPPISPKIISKGYNFNFDDIDDPFATKTKIRMSPIPDTPDEAFGIATKEVRSVQEVPKKVNKGKSQLEKKKPKKQTNSSFSDNLSSKISTSVKYNSSSNITPEDIVLDNVSKTFEKDPASECKTENYVTSVAECQKIHHKSDDNGRLLKSGVEEVNKSIIRGEIQCNDKEIKSVEQTLVISNDKSTSSSEQYFSLGTSSGEGSSLMNRSKNVFNLPEIDDVNFNPFASKSKMRMSPPPAETPKSPSEAINEVPRTCFIAQEQSNNNTTKTNGDPEFTCNIKVTNDSSLNASTTTCSSKNTNDVDSTVREILTEDEDTIEGPFLEVDEIQDAQKLSDVEVEANMINFGEMSQQERYENMENDELFIDADAFEFLLNQNKSTTVLDSGKESLFLKFDPLFAKRVSSDGILAAFNRAQKGQSTPKKLNKPKQKDVIPVEKSIPGPSNDNENYGSIEEYTDDLSSTVTKPMMVVNPAVSSIIAQKKSATPKLNRRSLTFTSPAMAVIDRLLSLSGNSSHLEHDASIPQIGREHSETDLAITQLRELLAEKEINVHSLRSESKELKNRLSALETQVRGLEIESAERLAKINELNEKLLEKTKINKSMAVVVEEYERTIASLIAETEHDKKRNAEERMRLIKERDEQTAHLTSMEVSFSDLHSKYEKSKQIILSCKTNEDIYKKSMKEFQDNFSKMQNNYELLKQHATSKLNHANQELEKMNRAHEAEVLKMNAMIKRKELHITSLEETLAQKTKANEELTAICDELINKVG